MESFVIYVQLDITARPQRLVLNAQVESTKLVSVTEMRPVFAQNAPQVATVLQDKTTAPVVQLNTTVAKVVVRAQRVRVVHPLVVWKPLVRTPQSAPSVLKAPSRVMDWQPLDALLVEQLTAL